MIEGVKISKLRISSIQKPWIIAEVGQSHEGSLGLAYSFIDESKKAGADFIKFQLHFADFESTVHEPFRINFSRQDNSRLNYWKRTSFTFDQWEQLIKYSEKKKINFIGSTFSGYGISILKKLGVKIIKIGSGDSNSPNMIDAALKTKLPLIISTGMSSIIEIEKLVNKLKKSNTNFALLQCTSKYPTQLKDVGLNNLNLFKSKFNCPVGLSDHTGEVFPSIFALSEGAVILENHVTFHKNMFGPDVTSSMTFDQLKFLVEARNAFWILKKSSVDKNLMEKKLRNVKIIFQKSLSPKYNLKKGTILDIKNLTFKKPGLGILEESLHNVLGKKINRNINSDEIIKWEDIE